MVVDGSVEFEIGGKIHHPQPDCRSRSLGNRESVYHRGLFETFRPLIVSHKERGERLRIISARQLTPAEQKDYEEERKD
jgi:uncharacterized DUF497 family protein